MNAEASSPRRSRRGSGAVTLHDVAKLAGVAPITASRALNTPAQVSPEVLRKVSEAVARTGYVRNVLAGGLASTRSRLVAAVVPTIAGPVFLQTVQSLTEALAEQGYQLMLGQSGYTESREDALLDAIIGRRPDGIVLTGILHSTERRRRLLAAGIPVVETWDLTPTPLDMLVGFSHAEVGRAVADFLRARGRRRLAVVAGDDERSRRRHQAFCDAARDAGLPEVPLIYVPAPTTLGSGRRALAELIASSPGIDAVFCSSDLLALGVMTEAQARGIPVPQRLAVVGFGDLEFAADLHPALTTVRIDSAAIGRQAARFIVDRAEGREVAERVVDIGFSIVDRATA
ncbi:MULTISPECIES: LacI family DNA-binding transcriptional regulator [unclassified Variovorax]|uniref:LacI family DNA-binding transcriptional regulator n=1 Tax=unclassified Variovorax TaxID=663243 RepID=UPI00076D3BD3|nr:MULTISPECIES: LacI family DNA-binding transcriptional regulator [unclassified Variovorax]KWT75978.1 Transcriptional regulator, LacI family [Variovorax sp. WDL1]PNG51602.1 HTH-type transcriptional regulator GntR [Variovorax sp. B2]PNG54372.1 HTH-type transcriptional regulator GntR [Variovorax sp. B4]VTV11869.1 Gluconate utilization system GNT-I transcriptional repressor [Variovorax sp. WDL1]